MIDDDDIAGFIDVRWRAAMSSARQMMETLRDLTPELDAHLPEKAAGHIHSALSQAESAYSHLHHAGVLMIGEEEYAQYINAQTQRKIGS